MNDTFQGITKEAGEEANTERSCRLKIPSWLNALSNVHNIELLPVYSGMSSSISVAPSRPTVIITSPNVLVLNPASQYVK